MQVVRRSQWKQGAAGAGLECSGAIEPAAMVSSSKNEARSLCRKRSMACESWIVMMLKEWMVRNGVSQRDRRSNRLYTTTTTA